MPRFFSKAGSPVLTLGLVIALAAWYLILAAAGSVPFGWEPFDLVSFRLFAILLFLNLIAGAAGALRRRLHLLRFALYLAALFVLVSGAYSYLFRFEGTVGLAEGEAYEPVPPMFRSVKRGPLAPIPALAFTLTRVDPDSKKGRVVIVQRGSGREVGTAWEKLGGSEIRYSRSSLAPLVIITSEEKGELERSYVKLDLDRLGQADSFNFDTLPYDFYLWKESPKNGGKGGFWLNVRRGKLGLFDGAVAIGQKVPVQGVVVTIEEPRKYAVLDIRSRPGFHAFLVSAGVLAVALLAAMTFGREPGGGSQG